MAKAVVSLFDTLDAAKAARQRLIEGGFEDVRIRIVGPGEKLETEPVMSKDVADAGERTSEKEGIAGVIGRMLSGWLISDRITEYAHAVQGGKALVALDVPDDEAAQRAAAILEEARAAARPPPAVHAGAEANEPVVDPTDTLTLPQVYSLPNAPTDWGEATRGEQSAIDTLSDPGRPDGSIEDAQGLGTDDTDDAFAARKAAQRGQGSSKRRTVGSTAPRVRKRPAPGGGKR